MKYLYIIFTLSFINCLEAQNNPSWVIQAKVVNTAIEVNWFPSDPATWKEGLGKGYTLTRETVSGGSNFAPVNVVIKNEAWFKANAGESSGVLLPIGKILYSDNFLTKSNKKNDELQYHYIVYETMYNINVAEAAGLGYLDKNTTQNATYRYTVRHNKSGQSTSITVKCEDGVNVMEPKDFHPEFSWPDGNSLSDMLEKSKPFELRAIVGKTRPLIDSVKLRWAPTTIDIWRNALEDGYEVWRSSEGKEPVRLATIKPWTESQLRKIPWTDTLALLAAAFVMDRGVPQGIEKANLIDRSNMESNYFGFALVAADRSPLAADILGLSYVDKDVQIEKIYKYEIRSRRLIPNFPVPDIWVTNEFEPLLAPDDFKVEKKEGSVTLKWRSNDEEEYGSYIIERLNPGDTVYRSLTKSPLVFIKADDAKDDYQVYVDSLPVNNVTYQYRIKGSNAFGEWSDYAYGSGYGRDLVAPKAVSFINANFYKQPSAIRISWTANKTDKDLQYHQVLLSDNSEYGYSAISAELPPSDTAFVMDLTGMDSDRSFYFKITSVDSSGNVSTSSSRFVFVPDYDRPAAPAKITATISEKGLVTVQWNKSISKDVVGYYIFFANTDPKSLALVFDKALNDTTYSWKLDMNSLTKKIYLAVKAEDDNYNRSFLSEILELRRPDTIAPVKPFLSAINLISEQVEVSWKKSSSLDVVKYLIYRKIPSDSLPVWVLFDSVEKEILQFSDKNGPFGREVQYAVKAADDFGNQSEYSNTVQLYVPFPGNKFIPILNKLEAGKSLSVSISWQKDSKSIDGQNIPYTYQLFRSEGSQQVTFYKEVASTDFKLEDINLFKNVLYNYAVRVKYDNGWTSELSEVKSIIIK